MAGFRNRIVVLVRFSYPALSGFATTATQSAALFDPDRMDRRFRLFEHLTLPSLLAQRDGDFRTIFLVGEAMPADQTARLKAAIAPLPGAQVVALPPMQHYAATQAAFGQVPDDGATHLTSVRLDDDDALDRGHVARLRAMAEGLHRVCGQHRPVIIGANRGFFLDTRRHELFDVVERLPIGAGLAMLAPVGAGVNVFRRNHRLLPQFFATLTDVATPAFIRTIHGDNDSEPHASGLSRQMAEADIARAVADHFPFTADMLKTL